MSDTRNKDLVIAQNIEDAFRLMRRFGYQVVQAEYFATVPHETKRKGAKVVARAMLGWSEVEEDLDKQPDAKAVEFLTEAIVEAGERAISMTKLDFPLPRNREI